MTTKTPPTISLLSPNGFLFGVQKYPELTYFLQEVQLPSIQMGESLQSTSLLDIKTPGDTLVFDDLQINFLVDERMDNYLAIQDWMFGLGFPIDHEQSIRYFASARNAQSRTPAAKMVSDCFLTILSSDNLPTRKFSFIDAFPTALSGISMQSTGNDVPYVVATLTMAYSYFTVD